MKAKTKRRLRHVLTKKKLVKKKTSRAIMRSFLVGLATISFGSLAYAITLNKPTTSVAVGSGPAGITLSAPATPTQRCLLPGPAAQSFNPAAVRGTHSAYQSPTHLPAPPAHFRGAPFCASQTSTTKTTSSA